MWVLPFLQSRLTSVIMNPWFQTDILKFVPYTRSDASISEWKWHNNCTRQRGLLMKWYDWVSYAGIIFRPYYCYVAIGELFKVIVIMYVRQLYRMVVACTVQCTVVTKIILIEHFSNNCTIYVPYRTTHLFFVWIKFKKYPMNKIFDWPNRARTTLTKNIYSSLPYANKNYEMFLIFFFCSYRTVQYVKI